MQQISLATSSCCMLETSHKTTTAAHAQVPLHFRLTALTKPRFHVEFHSCVSCVCAGMLIHHFIPHRRSLFRSLSLAACCANFRSHPTWHDEMWKAKNVIFYLLSCRSLSGRKVFQHFHVVDFKILPSFPCFQSTIYLLSRVAQQITTTYSTQQRPPSSARSSSTRCAEVAGIFATKSMKWITRLQRVESGVHVLVMNIY